MRIFIVSEYDSYICIHHNTFNISDNMCSNHRRHICGTSRISSCPGGRNRNPIVNTVEQGYLAVHLGVVELVALRALDWFSESALLQVQFTEELHRHRDIVVLELGGVTELDK